MGVAVQRGDKTLVANEVFNPLMAAAKAPASGGAETLSNENNKLVEKIKELQSGDLNQRTVNITGSSGDNKPLNFTNAQVNKDGTGVKVVGNNTVTITVTNVTGFNNNESIDQGPETTKVQEELKTALQKLKEAKEKLKNKLYGRKNGLSVMWREKDQQTVLRLDFESASFQPDGNWTNRVITINVTSVQKKTGTGRW